MESGFGTIPFLFDYTKVNVAPSYLFSVICDLVNFKSFENLKFELAKFDFLVGRIRDRCDVFRVF